MSDVLVLFCGGPAIYSGGPKPLQKLSTGETLLERYLCHIGARSRKNIVLLVEEAFETDYIAICKEIVYPGTITTIACPDGSSTLSKVQIYLRSGCTEDHIVMFSYPDIFVLGEIIKPIDTDPRLSDSVFISFTPISSRFPRLIVDEYDNSVQGISRHSSQMPANPLHVFGGHLLVRSGLINTLIQTFLYEAGLQDPSLEFDMFFWLINTKRMQSMPVLGRWIQADSARDLEALLRLE